VLNSILFLAPIFIKIGKINLGSKNGISLALLVHDFHPLEFLKIYKFSTILLAEFLYRISPRSVNKREKYRKKFIYTFKLRMNVIEPIFKKSRRSIAFAKKSYAEFHENISACLVTGTRSQT